MSERSDDTDILLLIPPDFFFSNSSLKSSLEDIQETYSFYEMSGNYNYLPPRHRIELENIDTQLYEIEKKSPISLRDPAKSLNYENQYNGNEKNSNLSDIIYHSTPKYGASVFQINKNENSQFLIKESIVKADNVINEIDIFLEKNEDFKEQNVQADSSNKDNKEQESSLPLSSNPEVSKYVIYDNKKLSSKYGMKNDNLISLSEIWNKNNIDCNESLSLQEERLRRQHCEKIIQALQHKLLEYQQKISVAIQVDKAKDNALQKVQEENRRLETLTNELDEVNEKSRSENEELKKQKESLEKELYQALKLISKFQDKNEILEIKVENLTRASTEVDSVYKRQIEDLKLKLSAYKKNEEISNEELNKMKVKYEDLQEKYEESVKEKEELKKNLEAHTVQLSKSNEEKYCINNKFDEMKKKIDELGKKNKLLENSNLESIEKEKCLMKELENQRISLKSHYQQQLECVVARKLKEYQLQLDTLEETLKNEAKERERMIAERAIKQVEMVNEKNEQEIMLLKEKHKQEVELYRIQLANSSKKIYNIEKKLEDYRARRADIAEKLHHVMETQWRKALEILTNSNSEINVNNDTFKSDNGRFSTINSEALDEDKLDGLQKCNSKVLSKSENECFEIPSSITLQCRNNTDNREQKTIDRLQAYIEMLLNKSPNDLDNLKEILAMPKVNRQTNKNNKNKEAINVIEASAKPPWK